MAETKNPLLAIIGTAINNRYLYEQHIVGNPRYRSLKIKVKVTWHQNTITITLPGYKNYEKKEVSVGSVQQLYTMMDTKDDNILSDNYNITDIVLIPNLQLGKKLSVMFTVSHKEIVHDHYRDELAVFSQQLLCYARKSNA
jgi:hypothetical protein